MMIVKNNPKRAVWLDFDRAQTYHADSLSERQKFFIEMEALEVSQLAEELVSSSRGYFLGTPGYWMDANL